MMEEEEVDGKSDDVVGGIVHPCFRCSRIQQARWGWRSRLRGETPANNDKELHLNQRGKDDTAEASLALQSMVSSKYGMFRIVPQLQIHSAKW